MTELFIPYPLAVIAKDKGFNEPCLAYYESENDSLNLGAKGMLYNNDKFLVSAALYQQLVDWFRKTHEIYIIPFIQFENADKDGDWKEEIINAFMVLNLKKMREEGKNYLPYNQSNDLFKNADKNDWYESFREAVEEAFTLIP